MALTPKAVHLWRASLALPAALLQQRMSLLSPDEIERAMRLRAPICQNFMAARSALRLILSQYLGCPPTAIAFTYSDRGKPRLAPSATDQLQVQFNLAHSQDIAVYAIALDGAIGVDVEYIRPVPSLMRLACRYFSPQERSRLEALPEAQRLQQFFDLWTEKEAYVKATGEGITGLPTAIRPANWFFSSLRIEPGIVVAVTASIAVDELHLFRYG